MCLVGFSCKRARQAGPKSHVMGLYLTASWKTSPGEKEENEQQRSSTYIALMFTAASADRWFEHEYHVFQSVYNIMY